MTTKNVSAADARRRLEAGNARFVADQLQRQDSVAERRRAVTGGQAPFAMVLTCSDSRVIAELIFDQHIGDLFVARIAGNFITDAVLSTLHFGHAVLGVQLIVVLGHESCGAIDAVYESVRKGAALPPPLAAIEAGMREAVAPVVAGGGTKDAATRANAEAQALRLSHSPFFASAVAAGEVTVVPAVYHLGSGAVTFLDGDLAQR